MLSLHGGISRPVLILEWLMCFVPLTLLWVAAVTLIVSLDRAPPDLFLAAAFGTLGPIALIVSLRTTASRRNVDSGRYARWLVFGFAAMVLLQQLNAGVNDEIRLQWLRFDFGTFLLVCLLPLFGALHFDRFAHIARSGEI